jgi:GNAT superfamily N-acetyltransferase
VGGDDENLVFRAGHDSDGSALLRQTAGDGSVDAPSCPDARPPAIWQVDTRETSEEETMIRQLEAHDRSGWDRLWRGYLHFYRGEVTDEDTAIAFDRLTTGKDGLYGLVAVGDDGNPVGFAHLVFHPSTWSARNYCYLEDLYVDPSERGSGTARLLIEAAYAEADRRGAGRTYWETQEFNSPARSLYDVVAHRTSFIVYER